MFSSTRFNIAAAVGAALELSSCTAPIQDYFGSTKPRAQAENVELQANTDGITPVNDGLPIGDGGAPGDGPSPLPSPLPPGDMPPGEPPGPGPSSSPNPNPSGTPTLPPSPDDPPAPLPSS